MAWVLAVGAAWVAIAAFVAVVIGRGIRLADRKQAESAGAAPRNFTVDVAPPVFPTTDSAPVDAPSVDALPVLDGDATAPAAPEEAPPSRFRHPIPNTRTPAVRPRAPHPERAPSAKKFRP